MIRQFLSGAAFAAALIASPVFVGSAFAGQPLSAELQSPVAAPVKLVAAGAIWQCEGSSCRAEGATERTQGMEGCRALAKAVGPVAAYGAGFDAVRLAKCDAGLGGSTLAKAAPSADVASTR